MLGFSFRYENILTIAHGFHYHALIIQASEHWMMPLIALYAGGVNDKCSIYCPLSIVGEIFCILILISIIGIPGKA